MSKDRSPGTRVLDVIGSYGLACVLLLCLFVLTIRGTLYQVDHGLFAAKQRFFLSWLVWWSPSDGLRLPVFPGGLTCMLLLSINLLVGGLFRLRIRKRNVGVVIVHVGIVFMLLAGLVKTYASDEGYLRLSEGEQADFFTNERLWEVAVWEIDDTGQNPELVIEHEFLADLAGEKERTFTSPALPFDLVLSHFVPNARVLPKGPNWSATGPVVDGFGLRALPAASGDYRDIAGIHVEARMEGESQRGILWAMERWPWTVHAGGKDWAVTLRSARYPLPFRLRLDDFQKEEYPGMSMAKAFRSYVTKFEGGDSERILIQMNEPLRHGGLVLFQSSWGPANAGPGARLYSVFSVVRNPSDKWPEYSLWVITFGLLIAFGSRLVSWVRKQVRHHGEQEIAR